MASRKHWALRWIEPLFDTITGTPGNDTLIGTGEKDTIDGLGADDLLFGLGGKDRFYGGQGHDTLVGGQARDSLIGGPGNDVFRFESVNESKPGKADVITKYSKGDAIDVSAIDADVVVAGKQDFSYVAALTGVAGQLAWSSDGADGTIIEGDVDGDAIADFRIEIRDDRRDSLLGTSGDDTLIGYDDEETIRGEDGEDVLEGGEGADSLNGGNLADTIVGEGQLDVISGGDGDDRIWGEVPSGGSSPDHIDGGAGNDTINAVANSTVLGGAGDDVIEVDDNKQLAAAMLSGEGGNDTISATNSVFTGPPSRFEIEGGAGADSLTGGRGADTIEGGSDGDRLFGGEGEDLLIGGRGGDTINGSGQADIYRYQALDDSTLADPDLLTKLNSNADTIDLAAIDANAPLGGDQAFDLVADFTGQAGELRRRLDGGTGDTFFEGDVDGDSVADFVIVASGDHTDFAGFIL